MRVAVLLLYLLTLIPVSDICISGECHLAEQGVHQVIELVSHDCCTHQDHSSEVNEHRHSHEECQSRSQLGVYSERQLLRRTPVSITSPGFLLLFTQGALRAPPVVFSESKYVHVSLNLRLTKTTVIRC